MCLSFHDLVFVHFVFTLACLFVYSREQQRVVFSFNNTHRRERFRANTTKVILLKPETLRLLRILETTEISKRGITEKKKTQRRQRTTTRTDGSHELVKLRGFQFHRRHRSVATEDGESSIGSRHFLFFTRNVRCLFNQGEFVVAFFGPFASMLLTKYQYNELSISLSCDYILPMMITMDAFIVAQSSLRERAGGIFTSRNVTVRIFCPSRSSSVDGEI